jgi:hypothetical protein
MSQGQRFLAFAAATLALVAALAVLLPRLLGAAEPEGAVLTAVKALERRAPAGPLSFGTLSPASVLYQRLEVHLDPSGETALVTGTLDLEGAVLRPGESEPTRVSSLGLERIPFRRQGGDWEATRGGWPLLAAALEALEARRRDREQERPPGAGRRRFRARAWYLRSEREGVTVAEDWRLEEAATPASTGPVDELGTTRLVLRGLPDGGLSWRE